MYWDASSFNQPLNKWNVSKVTYMRAMFEDASSFNQPLNNWNVSKVETMRWMFEGASSFNQALTRTVNGTGHTGPSEFCATSI